MEEVRRGNLPSASSVGRFDGSTECGRLIGLAIQARYRKRNPAPGIGSDLKTLLPAVLDKLSGRSGSIRKLKDHASRDVRLSGVPPETGSASHTTAKAEDPPALILMRIGHTVNLF